MSARVAFHTHPGEAPKKRLEREALNAVGKVQPTLENRGAMGGSKDLRGGEGTLKVLVHQRWGDAGRGTVKDAGMGQAASF